MQPPFCLAGLRLRRGRWYPLPLSRLEIWPRRHLPGDSAGAQGMGLSERDQAHRLSGGKAWRAALDLYGPAAGAAAPALGLLGARRRQAPDLRRIHPRLQLVAADGEFGRPLASLLAARLPLWLRPSHRSGAEGKARSAISRAA